MPLRVLLTGANGYLGLHILSELLLKGYSVRNIVRSQAKADQILDTFGSYAEQMDFGLVPDITVSGAFNQVVVSTSPFDLVIHTASPVHSNITSNDELLDPAIKGTLEILKAVKEKAPHVKRIIVTSSCAAVVDYVSPVATNPQKVYTEEDWNPISFQRAVMVVGSSDVVYQASKKFAELAAWTFIEEESSTFDLVTLCPPAIYGPSRNQPQTVKDLNETSHKMYDVFINSSKDAPLPPDGVHMYVDVRDLASAHLLAATVPAASNERFTIVAGPASSQSICDILRSRFEQLEGRTPQGNPGIDSLPENAYTISNEKAKKFLGFAFRSFEETFTDMASQLLEIEKG
jgi:nucleoside-diphosphate-sugar epimerase